MYFLIEDSLRAVSREDLKGAKSQFVAVMNSEEWQKTKDTFEMGIDIDFGMDDIFLTKAEVNYDSLTGTFAIPDRNNPSADDMKFAFAMDEKGIVFIDNTGTAEKIINSVRHTKKWKMPSLERFLYDFLDQSEMFHPTVMGESRSLMNVPFVTGDAELDAKVIAYTKAAGFENLKGHKSVGGLRASTYNAMPIEGVEKLVAFMAEFEKENG